MKSKRAAQARPPTRHTVAGFNAIKAFLIWLREIDAPLLTGFSTKQPVRGLRPSDTARLGRRVRLSCFLDLAFFMAVTTIRGRPSRAPSLSRCEAYSKTEARPASPPRPCDSFSRTERYPAA